MERGRDGEDPATARFRASGVEADHAAGLIDLLPRQLGDFAAPPPGVIRKVQHVLIGRRQVGPHAQVFVMFEEALPRRIFGEAVRKGRHFVPFSGANREPEHPTQGRRFAVNGAGGRPLATTRKLILANPSAGNVIGGTGAKPAA